MHKTVPEAKFSKNCLISILKKVGVLKLLEFYVIASLLSELTIALIVLNESKLPTIR